MTEIWKDVVGFEGYYQVSSHGAVRSVDRVVNRTYANGATTTVRRRGGIMKFDYRDGYATVRLQADKRVFKPYVHRMVCEVFNGPMPSCDRYMVAHGDGNPSNNHFENLRWASPSENQRDREPHGTHNRGVKSALAKLTWDDVDFIRNSGESASYLAKLYNVTSANIRHILRMKTWVPLPK